LWCQHIGQEGNQEWLVTRRCKEQLKDHVVSWIRQLHGAVIGRSSVKLRKTHTPKSALRNVWAM
jgi:hypothetical protein